MYLYSYIQGMQRGSWQARGEVWYRWEGHYKKTSNKEPINSGRALRWPDTALPALENLIG